MDAVLAEHERRGLGDRCHALGAVCGAAIADERARSARLAAAQPVAGAPSMPVCGPACHCRALLATKSEFLLQCLFWGGHAVCSAGTGMLHCALQALVPGGISSLLGDCHAGFALCGFGTGEPPEERPRLLRAALDHLPGDRLRMVSGLVRSSAVRFAVRTYDVACQCHC